MTGNYYENALAALHAIARVLSAQDGQRETLLDILDVIERQLGMVRCTVMLLSPDGQELHVEAAGRPLTPEQRSVRYRRGEGVTGRVIQTGKSAIIPRVSDEPAFQDRIHQRRKQNSSAVSFVCVPVSLGSEVVGTLAADVPLAERECLEQKERVLSIIAGMIAHDVKARRQALAERQALEAENLRLRESLAERFRPENILGNSRAMREVYLKIQQVAPSDTTVLIRGESGTGKELVASAIHYGSPRARRPFVRVNCAALNENLLESELFGHEKGAFTGALQARAGRLEEAEGGTLFLDEIGDFSPAVQVKLLRVLQEREFSRVGANRTQKADVRILAATNRDLEALCETGGFRPDLYYRINVFPLRLPPLRERKDDILLLADHFAERQAQRMGKVIQRISTPAINMMLAYHWPGNVRELENAIEHAVLLSDDGVVHGHNLPPTLQMPAFTANAPVGTLKARVNLLERELIVEALKRHGGSIAAVADELGLTARMIRYKIQKLRIDYARICKGS